MYSGRGISTTWHQMGLRESWGYRCWICISTFTSFIDFAIIVYDTLLPTFYERQNARASAKQFLNKCFKLYRDNYSRNHVNIKRATLSICFSWDNSPALMLHCCRSEDFVIMHFLTKWSQKHAILSI